MDVKNSKLEFSKRLNGQMKRQKMTVRKAAEVAQVGVSTVQAWRSGALPTDYEAVKRLANHFGVTLTFLLTGEEDANNPNARPQMHDVFKDGGMFFNGFCEISIRRLIPKSDKN